MSIRCSHIMHMHLYLHKITLIDLNQEQLEPDLTSSLGQTFILEYKGGGAVDRVQEQVR